MSDSRPSRRKWIAGAGVLGAVFVIGGWYCVRERPKPPRAVQTGPPIVGKTGAELVPVSDPDRKSPGFGARLPPGGLRKDGKAVVELPGGGKVEIRGSEPPPTPPKP